MLNNKGFVVSAILYTILLALLLFLGVTLAIFSSATSTIGKATDDLVNSTKLSISQVKALKNNDADKWYMSKNDILVKINSKYGILYWPRDFGGKIDIENKQISNITSKKHDVYLYCMISSSIQNEKVTFSINNPCDREISFIDLNNNKFYMYVSYDSYEDKFADGKTEFEVNLSDNNLIQLGE